jgi:hypothetical protein
MKRIILALGLFFIGTMSQAQNGLQALLVEKYYVADANDVSASSGFGELKSGSVTWRLYADMLPGYNFQMVYGNSDHPLDISSTTYFFNNEDRGAAEPTSITVTNTKKNSVMLDSWFSVGAAASGKMGVLKTDDNDGSVFSAVATAQNADVTAGIAIKTADGMVTGSPKSINFIGIDPTGGVFDATSQLGKTFTTSNGAWSILGGATGPNADTNRVLIGQFTTEGVFSFNLNIQIGTPGGGTENYVYSNPIGMKSEILMPSLAFTSNNFILKTEEVNASNSSVNIYPVPASNELNIAINSSQHSNDDQYTIYSIEGKIVAQKQLNNSSDKYLEKLDISSFPNGQYFVQVSVGGTIETMKLIKIQ